MAIKQYQAFREPSPYDRERQKAEQLRRYAELLQQQALAPEDEPYTFQGIRAMPSPAAALGKLLQAYGAKKVGEKAEEAEARKMGMEQEAASQIAGRLMGGRTPGTLADLQEVTPAGKIGPASLDDLTEVQIGSQYTRSPEDAMRVAMTPQGLGAVRGNPILAAALQQSMEAPKAEKFGTTPVKGKGGKYYLASESGRLVPTDVDVPEEEMTPYQKERLELDREKLDFDRSRPTTPKASESAEGLRKEFTAQTAPYRGIADAFAKIKNAALNPSAANDLALIFSYMRALDPASTVREGEFATAQNAAGVDVQVRNLYNKVVSGERLSQPQRQDFLQSSYGMVESQMPNVQQLVDRYTGIATRSGLNPEDIVTNPLQSLIIPRLTSDNDPTFEKLKKGDLFIAPNGKMMRKR